MYIFEYVISPKNEALASQNWLKITIITFFEINPIKTEPLNVLDIFNRSFLGLEILLHNTFRRKNISIKPADVAVDSVKKILLSKVMFDQLVN